MWQPCPEDEDWLLCVCACECGGIRKRNCNGDVVFSAWETVALLFLNFGATNVPRQKAERVSAYTLVTMRYFLYARVFWEAFLLFETRIFCYYSTVFLCCRPNPLFQLHGKGVSSNPTGVGVSRALSLVVWTIAESFPIKKILSTVLGLLELTAVNEEAVCACVFPDSLGWLRKEAGFEIKSVLCRHL